jgi:hypothetical protein
LFEVITEQSSQLGRIFSRQQVGAHVLGADRISLRLFVVLALVVTADGHLEAESDDQRQKRQRCCPNNVEILLLVLLWRRSSLANEFADGCCKPLHDDRGREQNIGKVENTSHRKIDRNARVPAKSQWRVRTAPPAY